MPDGQFCSFTYATASGRCLPVRQTSATRVVLFVRRLSCCRVWADHLSISHPPAIYQDGLCLRLKTDTFPGLCGFSLLRFVRPVFFRSAHHLWKIFIWVVSPPLMLGYLDEEILEVVLRIGIIQFRCCCDGVRNHAVGGTFI